METLHILAAKMFLGMAVVLVIAAVLGYITGRQVLRDGKGHREMAYLPAKFFSMIAFSCFVFAGAIYIWR